MDEMNKHAVPWKPTDEVMAAYLTREVELAIVNVHVKGNPAASTLHSAKTLAKAAKAFAERADK